MADDTQSKGHGKAIAPQVPALTVRTPVPPPPPSARPHSIGTPPPVGPGGSSRTEQDRRIEVRMAIGVADTGNPEAGDMEIDPDLKMRQYELIRELGRGGMGQVFLARDTKLARRVAIKFLNTTSTNLTERFLTEARTTALVNHENIVVIYEVDEHEGLPHMVLEYLEGVSLREMMRGRAFSPTRAVALITPVVRAIARAHLAGIVHRDLKPENIFVTVDGTVKVLDFGIAKVLGPEAGRRLGVEDFKQTGTTHSVLVGTPQYMAPEQFGGDIDNRADLWAVGIIMFELLTGAHPLSPYSITSLISSAAMLDDPMPKLGNVVKDLPERLERIVDRCLAKRVEQRYPNADALLADLEALGPSRYSRKIADDEAPYPGLSAFQEEETDRFFGRGRDVSRMLARLRDQPLVGIAGPSGIGKSSFVRAGVVPALKGAGEVWEAHILRPGRQPLQSLAGVLAPLTRTTGDGTRELGADTLREHEQLVKRLAEEPGYLGTLLRERAARKNTKILLFIDQFEELYTLVPDEAERLAFTTCLAGAADDATSPVRIVLSIRSDFLDRVGEDRRFLDELTRGLMFLQPLGRPELCEALTRPLDLFDYDFDSDHLVDRMLDELAATTGALPLLQFTASRLWYARDRKNKVLTTAAYEAMGGVAGALATHADEVLAAMPGSALPIVRQLFMRLVTPDRTRAICEIADLEQLDRVEVKRILDQLVAARLLVVETQGAATVEIVHESLIDGWPTLKRWLDEDQEDSAFVQQLAIAAKQWDAKSRSPGLLWRGDAMEEARRWHAQRPRRLAEREQAFLDAVFALDRRGKRARRFALAAVLVVLAVIAAGTSFAYVTVRAERDEKAAALEREQAAQLARREAEDARLVALADLLTEEQLRKAAEDGLISAEQMKAIAEARERLANSKRAAAENSMAAAEQRAKRAEAAKKAAEEEAKKSATEAAMTREQLLEKNKELEGALATLKAAKEKAEHESVRAEAARADAEKTKASLQKALTAEQARADKLENEKKKMSTTLK